jgi:hypothetical protein
MSAVYEGQKIFMSCIPNNIFALGKIIGTFVPKVMVEVGKLTLSLMFIEARYYERLSAFKDTEEWEEVK